MAVLEKIYHNLPAGFRDTALLRVFGFTKIPLLYWVKPSVIRLDDEVCIIKIPLSRRTKNHLGSMYFGALACGADAAGGLSAMKLIMKSGKKVSLAFKTFSAEFLKRPESDVIFTCSQGAEISKFVEEVCACDERMHMPVEIIATCPDSSGDEPVAKFTLELSLKKK